MSILSVKPFLFIFFSGTLLLGFDVVRAFWLLLAALCLSWKARSLSFHAQVAREAPAFSETTPAFTSLNC